MSQKGYELGLPLRARLFEDASQMHTRSRGPHPKPGCDIHKCQSLREETRHVGLAVSQGEGLADGRGIEASMAWRVAHIDQHRNRGSGVEDVASTAGIGTICKK